MNTTLKVLTYPDYRSGNFYQRLLEEELYSLNVILTYPDAKFTPFIFTKSVLKNKIDIIHIHWINPFVSTNLFKFLALIFIFIADITFVKYFQKKNIVWTVHNTYTHECKYQKLELILRKYLASISKYIFCHSISAKNEISKEYGISLSKVQVIPHGNYIDCYDNKINKNESRKKLKINGNDFVYLFFGQIRPYKGIEDLIEAFNLLNVNNTKLLIVGVPKDYYLENWIYSMSKNNKNIIFIPKFIPDNDIQIYMNASDVVVLPFKKILTSGSAVLALSFGKSIIAPDVASLGEILDDEGSILYDSSDYQSLLEAMKKALDSNVEKKGLHNLQIAKNLQWEQIAIKTHDIYKKCIVESKK
jgi:glycosyltransferase involved in cell wall biosynthesis